MHRSTSRMHRTECTYQPHAPHKPTPGKRSLVTLADPLPFGLSLVVCQVTWAYMRVMWSPACVLHPQKGGGRFASLALSAAQALQLLWLTLAVELLATVVLLHELPSDELDTRYTVRLVCLGAYPALMAVLAKGVGASLYRTADAWGGDAGPPWWVLEGYYLVLDGVDGLALLCASLYARVRRSGQESTTGPSPRVQPIDEGTMVEGAHDEGALHESGSGGDSPLRRALAADEADEAPASSAAAPPRPAMAQQKSGMGARVIRFGKQTSINRFGRQASVSAAAFCRSAPRLCARRKLGASAASADAPTGAPPSSPPLSPPAAAPLSLPLRLRALATDHAPSAAAARMAASDLVVHDVTSPLPSPHPSPLPSPPPSHSATPTPSAPLSLSEGLHTPRSAHGRVAMALTPTHDPVTPLHAPAPAPAAAPNVADTQPVTSSRLPMVTPPRRASARPAAPSASSSSVQPAADPTSAQPDAAPSAAPDATPSSAARSTRRRQSSCRFDVLDRSVPWTWKAEPPATEEPPATDPERPASRGACEAEHNEVSDLSRPATPLATRWRARHDQFGEMDASQEELQKQARTCQRPSTAPGSTVASAALAHRRAPHLSPHVAV
jgi:hypothetical protein